MTSYWSVRKLIHTKNNLIKENYTFFLKSKSNSLYIHIHLFIEKNQNVGKKR